MKLLIESTKEDPPLCPNEKIVSEKVAQFLREWTEGKNPDVDAYLESLPTDDDRNHFEITAGMGKLLKLALR